MWINLFAVGLTKFSTDSKLIKLQETVISCDFHFFLNDFFFTLFMWY